MAWLPWFNYSAVLPILREEFSLTSSDSGTILGAFQLGYVISVLSTGWLADKIGKKKVLIASALVTGVASLGFAFFAHDFTSALLWRILVGIGCGGTYTPGLALLSYWFPAKERGRAFGAYTGASVTAYAGSYFIAAPIAAATTWQNGVLWTSYPVFLAALAFSLIKERTEYSFNYESAPLIKTSSSILSVEDIRLLPVFLVIGAYVAHMWEQFAFWGWAGPFFATSGVMLGMEKTKAIAFGGMLAAVTVLIGTVAPWLGGMASDRFGRIFTAILISLVSAVFSFGIGWLIGSPLTIIIATGLAYGFFVVADSAIYKVGLSELIPPRHLGTGLAIQSALGFGAAIFSPKLFGMILDATNASTFQTVWGWAFVSLGIGALFSPLCLTLLRRYTA